MLSGKQKRQAIGLSFPDHIQLYSAFDLIGTEASCTDVDMAGRAVNDCLHALYVGLPGTVGTSVGVGDLNAKRYTLAANIALCQLLHLQSSKNYRVSYIPTDILSNFFSKCKRKITKNIFFLQTVAKLRNLDYNKGKEDD